MYNNPLDNPNRSVMLADLEQIDAAGAGRRAADSDNEKYADVPYIFDGFDVLLGKRRAEYERLDKYISTVERIPGAYIDPARIHRRDFCKAYTERGDEIERAKLTNA